MRNDLLINDVLKEVRGVIFTFDSYYSVKHKKNKQIKFDKNG